MILNHHFKVEKMCSVPMIEKAKCLHLYSRAKVNMNTLGSVIASSLCWWRYYYDNMRCVIPSLVEVEEEEEFISEAGELVRGGEGCGGGEEGGAGAEICDHGVHSLVTSEKMEIKKRARVDVCKLLQQENLLVQEK